MQEGKNVVSRKRALQEGITEDECYYSFVGSDGTAGEEWIGILERKGFPIDPSAKSVLRSHDFKPTSGEKNIIVIFNLNSLQRVFGTFEFKDKELVAPTPEIACLLLKKLKGHVFKAMRIEKLAVAHKPIITGHDNLPRMLVICSDIHGQRLSSFCSKGNGRPNGVDGVVYVIKPKKKKGKKAL